MYVSRNTFERHVDLLLIGKEGKRHYYLIKDFSMFMHDHNVQHFYCYCLQTFSTKEILNVILKIFLKLMVNKWSRQLKKGEYVRFKCYGRKIKSPFKIYAISESILVPEDNRKNNPDKS